MSYYARDSFRQMSQQRTKYPTGFSATDLPFYTGLDDQKFEEFCTDLLNLHPEIDCLRHGTATTRRIVKADRLLSGTDQRGSDIHATADKGEQWRLQCKHVQGLNSKQASKAMDLAENGFPLADQFVLVTSCALKDAVQQTIRDRPKWLWWGPSHLTNLTVTLSSRKDAENLVDRHFSPDDRRRLFPGSNQPLLNWQEFFAETLSPEGRRFHHGTRFIPKPDILSRLEAFAEKGTCRALILSAPGGQGKSRLLLELAKSLEGKPKAPRVFFLNLSSKGLDRDLADFLSREPKDLLLVVDDAHRLSAAMEDVARAAAKLNSVRLLVATRPEAVVALESQLHNGGYADRLEKRIDLFPWKHEDVYKLAEGILKPEHRHQAARLAGLADKCPLLVVLGGAMLNSGEWPETMTDHEAFREKVFKSFKNDFLERQPEHQRERLDQLIKLLAFVSPTAKNDTFYNKAAEILGCPPIAVGEDVKALQAARLVVENREGIRLYPDLFADAVLLDACLDQKGRPTFLHRTILSKLPITDFPALMRNVAQADWETRSKTGETGALFEPVWQEFVRRFQEGSWVNSGVAAMEWFVEPYPKEETKNRCPDRAQLLSQWAPFAVYLPEKTLQLAKLALQSVEPPLVQADSTSAAQTEMRSTVSTSLPALLKPIVTWHPQYAHQALDILWSLNADEPKGDWQIDSNAIAAIADAASFAFQKPLTASEAVMDWLEEELRDAATVQRFRRQPWILSALLKPFFGRAVEQRWSTGRTIHFRSLSVAVETTRPLRQRALAIVDRLLGLNEVVLCHAVIPVIVEAIHPVYSGFGFQPTPKDQEAWRPDRLEAVKRVERVMASHRDEPVFLLRLRDVLWRRSEYDPDELVGKECRRVRLEMPNTFELRAARVLASFSHDEIRVKPGPTFDADLKAAETQWAEFRRSVARETVGQYRTAHEVCEFLSRMVRDLAATNSVVLGGALLEPIAQISPSWCAALLEEALRTADPTLDGFLPPLLGEAARQVPEAYHKALESLPAGSRPQHLCALVSFLGWKHLHGGGLTQLERECVLASAKRTEEAVVAGIAWAAGCSFANDPQWAIEVLSRLKPSNERAGHEIVQALGFLAEKHAPLLDPKKVAECLANVGDLCFSERLSDERDLDKVARAFPKQVYEQVRALCERAEVGPAGERGRRGAATLSLGPIGDDEYVNREILTLWGKTISAEKASFAQAFRLALIRSLLWTDPATAPERLRGLIAACKNGDELELVTELAATRGSRFVFEFPDIVRALLARSEDLAVADAVRQTLWLSACGGGRSYSEHELDPQYRYILERGEALANRYRDDTVLHKFYRMVAESERHQAEWNKRAFQDDDDLD
jgi:hypothetical protein